MNPEEKYRGALINKDYDKIENHFNLSLKEFTNFDDPILKYLHEIEIKYRSSNVNMHYKFPLLRNFNTSISAAQINSIDRDESLKLRKLNRSSKEVFTKDPKKVLVEESASEDSLKNLKSLGVYNLNSQNHRRKKQKSRNHKALLSIAKRYFENSKNNSISSNYLIKYKLQKKPRWNKRTALKSEWLSLNKPKGKRNIKKFFLKQTSAELDVSNNYNSTYKKFNESLKKLKKRKLYTQRITQPNRGHTALEKIFPITKMGEKNSILNKTGIFFQ